MEKKIDPSLWTKVLAWLKARLTEPNTWTWIVGAAAYFGYVIEPTMVEYIAGVAVSVITLIQFAKKEPVTAVKEITPIVQSTATEQQAPAVTNKQ